ncbi:MAG TPA: hypothetical protein VN207_07565, partial [Ktedonobacteraceae bacterium]|nr:hypothetical protein [Ktedonobacteraceae bacterium]
MTDRLERHIDGDYLTHLLYRGEYLDHQILTVMKPLNLNQENVKAFIKETNPIFHLQYPHILPLVTLGMGADDLFYLIMDYAFNGTLIQESPLKALAKYPQDRLALAEDIVTALQHIPVGKPSALFSLHLLSTTASSQLIQVQDTSAIPMQRDSLLSASATPASDMLPSAVMLLNKHQPLLATPPILFLPTTISDPILQESSKSLNPRQFTYYNSSILLPTDVGSAAFSSSLASPPAPPRHGFVPSQPPVARRALTRKIEFLSVGLLLLLATGSMLFTLAMGIKLVKFPFLATTPPLAPKYVTATAVARAYTAYTTDTKKNGFMFGFDPA